MESSHLRHKQLGSNYHIWNVLYKTQHYSEAYSGRKDRRKKEKDLPAANWLAETSTRMDASLENLKGQIGARSVYVNTKT